MKKKTTILVPTDFSAASRSAMRFAIQWARQQKSKIIYTHVLDIIKFADWNKKKFEAYAAEQRTTAMSRLRSLVYGILRRTNTPAKDCDIRQVEGAGIDKVLADLGRVEDIDFICMGTNGAGTLQRVLGTNTGNLIRRSEIPVIAVPAGYRSRPIKRILYATDLTDYRNELKRVQAVSRALGAETDVLHFLQTGEPQRSDGIIYRIADLTLSLADDLQQAVRVFRPSIVVMFTDQKRSWFRRLVYPSQAERMSYNLSVPLLVMAKR
jgi:nucleotide-binding universal stress UspA family protein